MRSLIILFVLFISIPFLGQNKNDSLLIKPIPNTIYITKGYKLYSYNIKRYFDKESKILFDSLGYALRKHDTGKKKESIEATTTTQNLDEKNNLPVEFKITDYNYWGKINNERQEYDNNFKGITLIGKFDNDNQFILEKLLPETKYGTDEAELKYYINEIGIIGTYPKIHLKIGDSFKYERMVDISKYIYIYPEPETNILNVIRIFTLKKIKNNIAYFEISESLNEVLNEFGIIHTLNLNSSGLMKINIGNNFVQFFKVKTIIETQENMENGYLFNKKKYVELIESSTQITN